MSASSLLGAPFVDRDSAVARQDRSGDVAGLGGGEKENRGDDLSGSAKRPSGIIDSMASRSWPGIESVIRVFAFGEITFTVTPKRASSFAAVRENPITPAFAAA